MSWTHRPTREGATSYGVHFLGDWDCEKYGYLRYRAPHPRGEGLAPTHKSSNLLFGAAIHEALEAYYQSGWKDGNYDPECALAAFTLAIGREADQWYSPEQYEKFTALGRAMIFNYYEWYGPNGRVPEYPEIRVATDRDGLPIIEREYTIPLGGNRVFTCRVDLAVWRGDWLCLMEHKTTSRGGLSFLLNQSRYDSQFTGEYLVLSQAMGDQPLQGIIVNAMIKDASPRGKTPPFVRDYCYRGTALVEQFKLDLANRLERIDQLNDKYDGLVAEGMDPWEAARHTYPTRGMSAGMCSRFGQTCPYMEMCLGAPHEPQISLGFNPTIYPEEPIEDNQDQ
jgi:hypothetical protein